MKIHWSILYSVSFFWIFIIMIFIIRRKPCSWRAQSYQSPYFGWRGQARRNHIVSSSLIFLLDWHVWPLFIPWILPSSMISFTKNTKTPSIYFLLVWMHLSRGRLNHWLLGLSMAWKFSLLLSIKWIMKRPKQSLPSMTPMLKIAENTHVWQKTIWACKQAPSTCMFEVSWMTYHF